MIRLDWNEWGRVGWGCKGMRCVVNRDTHHLLSRTPQGYWLLLPSTCPTAHEVNSGKDVNEDILIYKEQGMGRV